VCININNINNSNIIIIINNDNNSNINIINIINVCNDNVCEMKKVLLMVILLMAMTINV